MNQLIAFASSLVRDPEGMLLAEKRSILVSIKVIEPRNDAAVAPDARLVEDMQRDGIVASDWPKNRAAVNELARRRAMRRISTQLNASVLRREFVSKQADKAQRDKITDASVERIVQLLTDKNQRKLQELIVSFDELGESGLYVP
jgi:hypothetical protein